ncbi:hypothetical protein RJ640_000228 [Escallonia rubra]|uniref:RNase H type-1 domain-containing protein n=1 Tax=Escallonia rubra TaxID=112253 RepID=A0AA88UIN9_9ASTE|nr:hypothetical protein RJ640_000228 [Escallonia rubra]
MGKWVLTLIEYNLTYVPQKAVKGQALADFLANHPCNNPEDEVIYVGIAPWRMTFDGSKTSQGAGAGIVLISPDGNIHQFAFQIEKDCANNQAEYEALIIGLEILFDMHITIVQISRDSQLANGQAEATNKSIKHIMERAIEDSPNEWHRLLSEVLWAFRTSHRSSTGITPYVLTYGHDPVLPMEITVKSFLVAMQNSLPVAEYNEAMAIELEDLDDHRLDALDILHAQKLKVSRSYNRRVLPETFHEGNLVWKTILPIGSKDLKFELETNGGVDNSDIEGTATRWLDVAGVNLGPSGGVDNSDIEGTSARWLDVAGVNSGP